VKKKSPKYIRDRVMTILQLPALPKIASQVVELVDNPQTSAAKLSKVISTDQGLTSKVLKVANSPFYGFPKRISTVDFAVIVLGFDALKEIVISISLISALQNRADKYFNMKDFWDHAIMSAGIGRRLAREIDYRVSGEVFVAALLHDMGISILHRHFFEEYKQIVDLILDNDVPPLNAEREILGVTHCDIGGWLAERWNLPGHIREAIMYHHTPEKAIENPDIVALIHCADVISNKLTESTLNFDIGIEFNDAAVQRLDLDRANLVESFSDMAADDEPKDAADRFRFTTGNQAG
jgi:HD-like signal output (HDOD) protein